MKNILFTVIVAFALTSCNDEQKSEFSAESLSAELTTLEGERIPFGDMLKNKRGETILIEVWASWCGDCVKAMPKIKDLQIEHPDVSYIFVSMDKNMEAWKSGIEKHELEGDHYWAPDGMQGEWGKATDIDWIPRYIIIDKTGNIATYRAIETDFDQINSTLKSLK
ncbi:MAG: TlpA family protein disulfide reductase [Flavobacterium sp.]|nr:TlpA family protein disulfide reductase [Flavobacterium sp.]